MQKHSIVRSVLVFILITAAWTAYRYFTRLPVWADEFIAKPIIDLLPILFVTFVVENNAVESLGITANKWGTRLLIGLGLGALLVLESVFAKFIKFGGISQVLAITPVNVLFNLAVALATAITEEIVFRGYFFKRFMWMWDNEIVANIGSTVFFTLSHVPLGIFILHYSGYDLFTYLLQIYVLGTILAFVFARVESLLPNVIAHTIWNFANSFIK